MTNADPPAETWRPTACILCSRNCGIEVARWPTVTSPGSGATSAIRSPGATCARRPRGSTTTRTTPTGSTAPLRRRPDGSFEEVSWETAIAEIAARIRRDPRRPRRPRPRLLRGRRAGQPPRRRLRSRPRRGDADALPLLGARPGEDRRLLGQRPPVRPSDLPRDRGRRGGRARHPDRHQPVAGARHPQRARHAEEDRARTRRAGSSSSTRSRTESAALADLHLRGAARHRRLPPRRHPRRPGARGAGGPGLPRGAHHRASRRCAPRFSRSRSRRTPRAPGSRADDVDGRSPAGSREAKSAAVRVDLGLQQSLHSTLNSYLEKLLSLVPGHFGRPGCNCLHTALLPLAGHSGEPEPDGRAWRTAVTGVAEIGKLFPPNVLPAEIDTDRPDRIRGLVVDSANPAVTSADTAGDPRRLREARAARRRRRGPHRDGASGALRPAGGLAAREVRDGVLQPGVPHPGHAPAPAAPAGPARHAARARDLPAPPRRARRAAAGRLPRSSAPSPASTAAGRGCASSRPPSPPPCGCARAFAGTRRSSSTTRSGARCGEAAAAAPLWGAAHLYASKHADGRPAHGPRGRRRRARARRSSRASWRARAARSLSTHRHDDDVAPDPPRRRAHPPRRAGDAGGARAVARRAGARRGRRVPARAHRRRAALVERQPGAPRPRLAPGRPRRRAPHPPGGRAALRADRRRPRRLRVRPRPDRGAGRARRRSPGRESCTLPHGYGMEVPDAAGRRRTVGPLLNWLTDAAHRDPLTATPYHKFVPVRVRAAEA